MLADEIEHAQRLVRTDAYQMSIGEIVSMYNSDEIVIDPEFQRLFRWEISQKSRLIESLLLGIPLPSIFVFESEGGKWELIDGLQRLSTILEFMGQLKSPDGGRTPPSILEATKYLPSLHNAVWEPSKEIDEVPLKQQVAIGKERQLAIRRGRLGVEILKRPSDIQTKYDLFQRLNAGGTQANAQELRNCIMLMVHPDNFRRIKAAAEEEAFLKVVSLSEEQIEKQRHMELAVRFLVHANVPYDGSLDVEEYIDEGIVTVLKSPIATRLITNLKQTFKMLYELVGADALRRFDGTRHIGKVGLVGLEGIAVGIGKNLKNIRSLNDPGSFLTKKIRTFWAQSDLETFMSPGLRGTIRIQRTVPFGEQWFSP